MIALNEQVLYSRIDAGALRPGTLVFVDSSWAASPDELHPRPLRRRHRRFRVARLSPFAKSPSKQQCRKHTDDPRKGKNMWVLGLLCALYDIDDAPVTRSIAKRFAKKGEAVVRKNLDLLGRRLPLGARQRGAALLGAG